MQLQWLDLGILSLILLSVLTGLFRGFVKEAFALCAWILAIWLAYHYSDSLNPFLKSYIHEKNIRIAASFIIILFASLLIGGIANTALGFIMRRSGLSGTDRVLGMGFGLIRGIFIVALLMVAVKMTSLPYQQYAEQSLLYAQFTPVVDWLSKRLPEFISPTKTMEVSKNTINKVPLSLKLKDTL